MKANYRKKSIVVGGILIVIFSFLISQRIFLFEKEKSDKKNLIIISLDTLRADSMGVYGYKTNTTPNIDKWAKNATVFTNAYTQSPLTYPSMASLMTGISPFESSIYRNTSFEDVIAQSTQSVETYRGNRPLDENTNTLAGILQNYNYNTGAFILNHALAAEFTNLDKGFERYEIITSNPEKKLARSMLNHVDRWLEETVANPQPFFLWVHFLDPHLPYIPNPVYACRINEIYCGQDAERKINELDKQIDKKYHSCTLKPLDENFIGRNKEMYDAEVSETDANVGYLLDKIKKMNLDKNSLIVIYGDHGESFEHNFYFNHGLTLHESSVKIPLIIYSPEDQKHRKLDIPVKNGDIFTSILNLLHINNSFNQTDNIDFSKILDSSSQENDVLTKPMYFINKDASRFAIRKGRYKYILSLHDDNCAPKEGKELYDITNDPQEKVNLVDENEEMARHLNEELTKYVKKHSLDNISSGMAEEKSQKVKMLPDDTQEAIETLKSLGY